MQSQPEEEAEQKKPYHHGDLRNTLIQVGLEMLAEGGAQEIDLRKVARRAGVSHAAPYRHFADKQALIAAVMEVGYLQLTDQIRATLQSTPDEAFEQLLSVARAYVRFAKEHPWLMREMFSGRIVERESRSSLYAASKGVYQIYVEVIRRGQEQGSLIDGDPAALASVFWSLLHGLAMLIIDNQKRPYADGEEGTERVIRLAVETLYSGFACR